MSNAAIFFHPDGFDTSAPKLMGRQAAGESFLRGFLTHAKVDKLYFWNWSTLPNETCDAMVRRVAQPSTPIDWIKRNQFPRLAEPGCVFISSPANSQEAWNRRVLGPNRYSLCSLTHTTASQGAMDAMAGLLTAPVEPWDATICTSRAVTASVRLQLQMTMEYLRERFGPVREPPVRLETIPLGVNCADYARNEAHRADWRRRLGIADDDIVVLYVGRFSMHAKMHPVPMAMALERAARRTRRKIHWVLAGWSNNEYLYDIWRRAGPDHAPSVSMHMLDGRRPEVRFPIWSAGDVFLSLSDNIQETFGLTPVEAMAAGLPNVVSDWDGYRDLIQHGVEGFRIPTLAPRPGLAGDLAIFHGNNWESYDHYVGMASQFVSVDIDAAADALLRLFENDDLRLRMGEAGRRRAETVFDWRNIIPRYQALWAELAAIRNAAPAKPAGGLSPWRPDPFTLFSPYPTEALSRTAVIAAAPQAAVADAQAFLQHPSVGYIAWCLLNADEVALGMGQLQARGPMTVAEFVQAFAPHRRGVAERSVLWLAKYGFVTLSPRPDVSDGQGG